MRGRSGRSLLGVMGVLCGVAVMVSACSSDYPIRVITETQLVNPVVVNNAQCNVSGDTVTATGTVTGPANVVLELSVQNAAGKTVGTIGRTTKTLAAGKTWEWAVSANTGGAVADGCRVSTANSVRYPSLP